jgi:vancomycin resistance protein YoaR
VRDEHYWPDWDTDPVERTGEMPVVPADHTEPEHADLHDSPVLPRNPPILNDGLALEVFPRALPSKRVRKPPPSPRRRLGQALMVAGAVLSLAALVYTADLVLTSAKLPRGITVAGVQVGGMSPEAAEARLRRELEPRLSEPIDVRAGDAEGRLDPVESGLSLNWYATVKQAGAQPLNPITRIESFFTTREVGVVPLVDGEALEQAVNELARTRINRPMVEGGIRFRPIAGSDGAVDPVPVLPRPGQELTDIGKAMRLIENGWLTRDRIELPVTVTEPKATAAGVRAVLDKTVAPAVAAPIVVRGAGENAVLRPADIGSVLRFEPGDDGSLRVSLDRNKLRSVLQPQLAATQQEAKSASIRFAGGGASVQPGETARSINWPTTFRPFFEVAARQDRRELAVAYETRDPEVTTAEAEALGIKEVVAEYTTTGFPASVARNIRTIAAEVDGAMVAPGGTFSLDEHTGPRTASQGYVEAPVHEDGTGEEVLGGGVSQFTSTLYNAAYFAGLRFTEHTAHDYYLDRYPEGRDARSLNADGSGVDLAFVNDTDTGIAIQTSVSGGAVTVRIWGTRHYRVESESSTRSDIVPAPTEVSISRYCEPAQGEPGFAVSDTRIFYDLDSGEEVRRETRTVRYEPKPHIECNSAGSAGTASGPIS